MKNILLALLLASGFSLSHATEKPSALHQAIEGKQRSVEHKNRDKYRHPQQTLEFLTLRTA